MTISYLDNGPPQPSKIEYLEEPKDVTGNPLYRNNPTFREDASYSPNSTDPFEQRLVENASTAVGGMGVGEMAGLAGSGVASLFKASPTLLSAGIKPTTILKMTPRGTNPAEFGTALEQDLNNAKAIGSGPSETWQRMNALKNAAGQGVGNALRAIAGSAGPDALSVNAGEALQPIIDGWAERAAGATNTSKAMARPFEQVHNYLVQKAASQGGRLNLDNLREVMDEIGPLVHKGPEAMQEAMSELYGALADSREKIVQGVADQSGNPALSKNLLDSNASFSKYIRLMPDVARSAAQSAVKPAISTFAKYSPYLARIAELGGAYGLGRKNSSGNQQ